LLHKYHCIRNVHSYRFKKHLKHSSSSSNSSSSSSSGGGGGGGGGGDGGGGGSSSSSSSKNRSGNICEMTEGSHFVISRPVAESRDDDYRMK
jgi:hypothetical protein